MALNLKSKIAMGSSFLFVLLILVAGVSIYFFNKQIGTSKKVLKNNYESIQYGNTMLDALNNWKENPRLSEQAFEQNLSNQEHNITEVGERELTTSLRNAFEQFKKHPDSTNYKYQITSNIDGIINLNLNAIHRKNTASEQSAEDGKTIISVIIAFCVLVGFTFVFNFPELIAGPISRLTEGIKAIANKDYSQRIHLNRKDEWGEMASAFNNMAERLDTYEHSNLAKIMFEKQRAETVINSLKDASIGIDNNGIIL